MDETTALLGSQSPPNDARVPPSCRGRKPQTIVLLLSLLVLFLSCSDSLSAVPSTRLLEDAICRRYTVRNATEAPIDEQSCKADSVQSELAYLKGLMDTLEAAIGLLVAFPYAALSDKIGRKPILLLFITGYFLSSAWNALVIYRSETLLPHTVLFSPAFFLIGGGRCVVISALHSAVSDVTTDDHRASGFLAIMFGTLAGSFIGPVVSSGLMQITSPWVPYLISFGIMLLGAAMLLLIPETLSPRKLDADKQEPIDDTTRSMLNWHLRRCVAQLKESLDLLRQPALAVLLVTFLAPMPMMAATSQFFVQYVSKRFEWSLAAAGYLLSLRGTVNMLLLLVILPGLSTMLLSRATAKGRSGAAKDRVLAQSSAVALTLGCLLMASDRIYVVVTGLVVNTLGAGLAAVCRSLAAYLVSAHHTAKLQTLIGMTEALGSLFAGPALAGMLSAGMKSEGAWMGLPYLGLAAFLSLTTLLPLFFVRFPAGLTAQASDDDTDPAFACARGLDGGCPLGSHCPGHAPFGSAA
ncbi:major facilitator superfamily protein [Hirsutella rhossiliensis]|uniref:Major facilitator superfamily domain-containing protein n=1 Tax=Hirsutella rhossiliensis TaxID=111463 RepID=A0A9P8SFK1_9HYPO|nr:major facilitator superfamily domain-containing protein [Hirsutella rhossiliensis]KAH0959091.1 major facilitator superfamily domain-containing protein [Hirsutella rhossiliensis]